MVNLEPQGDRTTDLELQRDHHSLIELINPMTQVSGVIWPTMGFVVRPLRVRMMFALIPGIYSQSVPRCKSIASMKKCLLIFERGGRQSNSYWSNPLHLAPSKCNIQCSKTSHRKASKLQHGISILMTGCNVHSQESPCLGCMISETGLIN